MIDERSPVIKRSPPPHHHHDRFHSNYNSNPNPRLAAKQLCSMDWTGSGESSSPISAQPQFPHQQIDRGFNLASSDTGSSLSRSAPSSGSTLLTVPASDNRLKERASEFPYDLTAAAMRDTYNRTKAVVRHLPPGLPESAFMEEIATRFSTMYNTVFFCPGRSSAKGSSFSRAYIDFKHPEDVIYFFGGFNGHVFVNERGTQYKALVEYAPNQRVPKLWAKKDPKEGSIYQDLDYIKFNEEISKPIEYLPSAEAQLERKDIERISCSAVKEAIVVTPLMEFVRQKRALKYMPQKSLAAAGKIRGRSGASSMAKMVLKRGADRSRANSMYTPGSRPKEKVTYVPRSDDAQRHEIVADKKGRVVFEAKDNKILPEDSGKVVPNNQALKVNVEQGAGKGFVAGKKTSGGLDKEELINGVASGNPGSSANGKKVVPAGRVCVTASSKSPAGSFQNHQSSGIEDSSLTKSGQRIESGGRVSTKGASSSRTPFLLQKAEQQNDQDKRFLRAQVRKTNNREVNTAESELGSNQLLKEDKNDMMRQDVRRLRNKDRPDRPVWTVRQRSDATESSKISDFAPSMSPPGNQRGAARGPRDLDNFTMPDTSKPPNKRAGSSMVYGAQEKQVWVAKPGSGS